LRFQSIEGFAVWISPKSRMLFMKYTSLLVHVEPGAEADGRLQTACGLAARFDAFLIGIGAANFEMPVLDPTGFAAMDPDLIASERHTLEAELETCARKFHAAAAAHNLRAKWYSAIEFPADTVCRHAHSVDLIIIGRGASSATSAPRHAINPADVLMRAGRPVLVVPPGINELRLEHAVVAWKDTREARRAVADSRSLLELAGEVRVVAICPDGEAEAVRNEIADVTEYLKRHNIAAAHEMRPVSHERAAAEILDFAEHTHSDLVVAGAYGHTRLREWVFGGVTHDLLKKSPVCCLLSH
jgi:nucleotide-binding universal stress UspA family protein